jgi:hypothetical protein
MAFALNFEPDLINLRGGRSCHEAINHPIRISRSGRRITSKRDMKSVAEKEAERRAWATENKMSGGGKKSGSGKDEKKS